MSSIRCLAQSTELRRRGRRLSRLAPPTWLSQPGNAAGFYENEDHLRLKPRTALEVRVRRIVQVAHPDKIILFGSAAHRQEALAGWQPAALGQ